MSNMYVDVATFIGACDQPRSEKNAELYKRLIEEEYGEFVFAEKSHDEVGELDACMDMIWVILGYCHMRGWDVNGAWHEVARSNLDKIDLVTNKVIKREDGKVLKPEGWKPPNLTRFV